jgi:hypothetical protein
MARAKRQIRAAVDHHSCRDLPGQRGETQQSRKWTMTMTCQLEFGLAVPVIVEAFQSAESDKATFAINLSSYVPCKGRLTVGAPFGECFKHTLIIDRDHRVPPQRVGSPWCP